MFNPSELEGEVDYSFFDSDCDDSSTTRDGGKMMEKALKAEIERPSAQERLSRSLSPTSTEASIDADSESSCSSNSERSSLRSPTFPKPQKSSSIPRERKSRARSTEAGDMTTSHTVESEDTVTDVSPLSSPDISPLQSVDLNHKEAAEGSQQDQRKESVPSSGLSSARHDEDSDEDVDECE